MGPVFESVRRTGRAVVVHEAHVNLGMGAEVCGADHRGVLLFVGGSGACGSVASTRRTPRLASEEHFLPDLDRVLDAVDRVLEF